MEGDHLSTEKVLAVRDALGNRNALETTVVDNLASAPGTVVVPILLDLEPVSEPVSKRPSRVNSRLLVN